MNWANSIKEFIPSDEQEKKDKEATLKYINIFDNILSRSNELIHITSSGFVINKSKDKVLMVHHNIFKAWSLPGGHADGDENLVSVATSEIKEETGLEAITLLSDKIVSLDLLSLSGHLRIGEYVTAHLHISVVYLFQADDNEPVNIKPDENSAVKWLPIKELDIHLTEPNMKKIYSKIIAKI
ncbi:NUDIX hydrolase [Clostridium manihotivorum]|uniref:NUDIX hydrolase n=1 Tax=Clostridium manihotivorum TaxID=2320868 RepID=A0A410DTK6_9CLOT|nr:NUDIX hydrolase [Clostridium manihotivorum]QAA32371.1 NUDIX hydrolase [Clostridium manihotivorum]